MPENVTLMLKHAENMEGSGMIVSRNLGLIDIVDVSVSNLKPDTTYTLLFEGQPEPIVASRQMEGGPRWHLQPARHARSSRRAKRQLLQTSSWSKVPNRLRMPF